MTTNAFVYKVAPRSLWDESIANGQFTGAPIDLEDGFIHFSSREQVIETVRLHFRGQDDLLLIEIPSAELGEKLEWEASRGGDLFPHLYDTFDPAVATRVLPLRLLEDGSHEFPEF